MMTRSIRHLNRVEGLTAVEVLRGPPPDSQRGPRAVLRSILAVTALVAMFVAFDPIRQHSYVSPAVTVGPASVTITAPTTTTIEDIDPAPF